MAETCKECGRAFAATTEQWFASHDREGYPNSELCGAAVGLAPSECRIHTIRRLKARVHELEYQLVNHDTAGAKNHVVHALIGRLDAIIEDGEQTGEFTDSKVQAFANRLLGLWRGEEGSRS